jgi:alkaline phosphatase D
MPKEPTIKNHSYFEKNLLTRRALNLSLRNAALALALAPWGAQKSWAQVSQATRNWKQHPFTLGVASGQPRTDSVVIWTRLVISQDDLQSIQSAGEPLFVDWVLCSDPELKQVVRAGRELTDASRGHSVRARVHGLKPQTSYWYQFRVGDAQSALGTTKTAPLPSARVDSLRFALASCQHYEAGEYSAYRDMAKQDLDFVLFVGDYIYETNLKPELAVRRHRGSEPITLEQYRDRYALYKADPHLQAAHAAHPWILMWDDHEVVNDYANDLDPAYSERDTFLKRRAAAYQAYFENQPVWIGPDLTSHLQASMRLHDQFQWGQLAELWTLDCRQFRSHHACSKPGFGGGKLVMSCEELSDPSRTMLGQEQEAWLNSGLESSQRNWKLLAQGNQISSTRISTPVGRATYTEVWDGYPEARKRLLEKIQSAQIQNVVTLGGDVHMNVAANLRLEPNLESSPILASEFVTTSISSRGLSDTQVSTIKANNSDILHMRADQRGYVLLSVDPLQVKAEFRAISTPALLENNLGIQVTYVVESGKPGPKRLS